MYLNVLDLKKLLVSVLSCSKIDFSNALKYFFCQWTHTRTHMRTLNQTLTSSRIEPQFTSSPHFCLSDNTMKRETSWLQRRCSHSSVLDWQWLIMRSACTPRAQSHTHILSKDRCRKQIKSSSCTRRSCMARLTLWPPLWTSVCLRTVVSSKYGCVATTLWVDRRAEGQCVRLMRCSYRATCHSLDVYSVYPPASAVMSAEGREIKRRVNHTSVWITGCCKGKVTILKHSLRGTLLPPQQARHYIASERPAWWAQMSTSWLLSQHVFKKRVHLFIRGNSLAQLTGDTWSQKQPGLSKIMK